MGFPNQAAGDGWPADEYQRAGAYRTPGAHRRVQGGPARQRTGLEQAARQQGGPARQQAARPEPGGGTEGNERLTAWVGAVLLILLAAEGVTILALGRLLTLHFFIGMLLLGPVTAKLCSTGYRFVRYYTGGVPYRRKGPPALLLRLLGPVVVAATLGVFGSGVIIAFVGPANDGLWIFLHKGSFVVWFGAMTVHVLAHMFRLPRLLAADLRPARSSGGYLSQAARYGYLARGALAGRWLRMSMVACSLAGGLVIAMLTVHLAGSWHHV